MSMQTDHPTLDAKKTKKELIDELFRLRGLLDQDTPGFFESILNNIAGGVALVRVSDGIIIYASPNFEKMFGYNSQELKGKHVRLLNGGDVQTAKEKNIESSSWLDEHNSWFGEILNKKKDGTEIWCAASVSTYRHPEFGKVWVGVHEDISERIQMEKALRESEARLSAFLENAPTLNYIKDLDGKYLYANKAFLEGVEFPADPMMGKTANDFFPPEIANKYIQHDLEVIKSGETIINEESVPYSDGTTRTQLAIKFPIFNENGEISAIGGINTDITQRKKAEDALLENEKRFRAVIDNSPNNIYLKDLEGNYLLVNRVFEETIGISVKKIIGKKATDWADSEVAEAYNKHDREVINKRVTVVQEEIVPYLDGTLHNHIATKFPIFNDVGTLVSIGGINTDITERKKVEEELRLHSTIVNDMAEGVFLFRVSDGEIVYSNPRNDEIFGYDPGELAGNHVSIVNAPGELSPEETAESITQSLNKTGSWKGEVQNIKKDGTVFWCRANVSTLEHHEHGTIRISVNEDITMYKRAEEELRANQRLLETVIDTIPIGVFVKDFEHRYVLESKVDTFFNTKGVSSIGKTNEELEIYSSEANRQARLEDLEVLQGGGHLDIPSKEYRTSDGTLRWHRVIKTPLYDDNGTITGLVGIREDITERKQAEERLKANQQLLQTVIDTVPHSIFAKDLEGRFILVNDTFANLIGGSVGNQIGKKIDDTEFGTREEKMEISEMDRLVLESGGVMMFSDFVSTRPDGIKRTYHVYKIPLRDHEQNIVGTVGIAEDITQNKLTEEKLRQSQKLEVVGQLAGGVAHEFNNMLQVIQGYTILALGNEKLSKKTIDDLEHVQIAAEQAANLTRELLSFGRKNKLQKANIDLNDLISNQSKMLRPIIRENIELDISLNATMASVVGDSRMLEQVLMNLYINSRDAMPNGGVLGIETSSFFAGTEFCQSNSWARPGDYLLVSVQDTGIGISSDNLSHVFEPFFTTKEVGKGSGLGLSVAYGIVQDHGGMIEADSVPEKGSTFRIYLPTVAGKQTKEQMPNEISVAKGSETILVAEDEPEVLNLLQDLLESGGYTVVKAANGLEALQILADKDQAIDLALLDVVMPKMGGWEVYKKIEEMHPMLPVIFSSGYDAETIDMDYLSEKNIRLIQKPYSPSEIYRAVRETLDRD